MPIGLHTPPPTHPPTRNYFLIKKSTSPPTPSILSACTPSPKSLTSNLNFRIWFSDILSRSKSDDNFHENQSDFSLSLSLKPSVSCQWNPKHSTFPLLLRMRPHAPSSFFWSLFFSSINTLLLFCRDESKAECSCKQDLASFSPSLTGSLSLSLSGVSSGCETWGSGENKGPRKGGGES